MKVGSICTGYGGLDLAVNGSLSWVSEIDKTACTVLETRYPSVPNLGDINHAKDIEPVDIITAGFPCQDISTAGRQAGIGEDPKKKQNQTTTRSGLWWRIRDVIGNLRPSFVVLENVPAILTNGGPAVIASLTEIGYNSRWTTLRASDIGACHRRERWFCVAWNAQDSKRHHLPVGGQDTSERTVRPDSGTLKPLPTPTSWLGRRPSHSEIATGNSCSGSGSELVRTLSGLLLPTPTSANASGNNYNNRGEMLLPGIAKQLLPTPTASQPGGTPEQHLERKRSGKMNRSDPTITDLGMVLKCLPTPTAANGTGGNLSRGGKRRGELLLPGLAKQFEQVGGWGKYQTALDNHEAMLGRPAPDPVDGGRLSPVFVEWMMCLPSGWVTDVGGVSRSGLLRLLGNGVVPVQAGVALQRLAVL